MNQVDDTDEAITYSIVASIGDRVMLKKEFDNYITATDEFEAIVGAGNGSVTVNLMDSVGQIIDWKVTSPKLLQKHVVPRDLSKYS